MQGIFPAAGDFPGFELKQDTQGPKAVITLRLKSPSTSKTRPHFDGCHGDWRSDLRRIYSRGKCRCGKRGSGKKKLSFWRHFTFDDRSF